jgi:glycogen operon protein
MRNLMATVLLSQGTPMMAHGDEYGRTQRGNNNAYCQDNEISWFDWRWDEEAKAMFAFTKKLLQLRRDHPALRRAKFFKGRKIRGSDIRDILWLRHDGEEMTDADWDNPHTASLGMLLAGSGIDEIDEDGHRVVDDDLYIVLNGSDDALEFVVPTVTGPEPWTLAVDTADDSASGTLEPGSRTRLEPRSLQLLVHPRELRGAQGPGAEVAARP